MNKTIRNKALKDANRLITADMNGEDWACPDGHFATAYPIYDGYKMKKSQRVPYVDYKPDLAAILPTGEYTEAKYAGRDENDCAQIMNIATGQIYSVNGDFYNLLTNIYPRAVLKVITNGDKFAPIEMHDNEILVAVVMPLKA